MTTHEVLLRIRTMAQALVQIAIEADVTGRPSDLSAVLADIDGLAFEGLRLRATIEDQKEPKP